jgi:hypothetical protein
MYAVGREAARPHHPSRSRAGLCRGVVAVFERSKPLPDLGQLGEVVGRDDHALDDGEEDLHLVQLGGVPLVGQAPGGTRAVGEELT